MCILIVGKITIDPRSRNPMSSLDLSFPVLSSFVGPNLKVEKE
jgi:hypothetical protein